MKLSLSLRCALPFLVRVRAARTLPPIQELIERAYPTWCIDADENRLDLETCADGTPNGRFTPIYLHKYPGIGKDPALGGYPSPLDTRYPFENASPFFGQVGAGSIYHCPASFDGGTMNYKTHCPKVLTSIDSGPEGAGHIAPHIALAALARAYTEEWDGAGVWEGWFDHDTDACRIVPRTLLKAIRRYYPRAADGSVYYPPPHSENGGAYPLEFRNQIGASCTGDARDGALLCFDDHSGGEDLYPDYLAVGHDSPRYCTREVIDADVPTDWCPYIFFGPNRGKYRHPHTAFSSLETYLANLALPDKCGTTWDDANYPPTEDEGTQLHFPEMTTGRMGEPQPVVKSGGWVWPGPEGPPVRSVAGKFSVRTYGVAVPPEVTARAYAGSARASSLAATDGDDALGPAGIAGTVLGAIGCAALLLIAFALVAGKGRIVEVQVTSKGGVAVGGDTVSVDIPPSVN